MQEGALFFTTSATVVILFLFIVAILTGMKWYLSVALIYIFLMANDTEPFFIGLWIVCLSFTCFFCAWVVCVCVLSHLVVDEVDCSPPGSSVHDTSQTRILGWIDISHSRRSSRPWDQPCFSCISCTGSWIFYHCSSWEAHWIVSVLHVFWMSVPYEIYQLHIFSFIK